TRMEHLYHLVLLLEPCRDFEGARHMLLHADGKRPQPAGHEKGFVARGEETQLRARTLDIGPGLLGGRDRAGKGVGVSHEHLGAGMNDDIGTEREGTVIERAGPRIVDDKPRAAG